MNDKSKNIILKLSKGIVYAYPIGFLALSLQWEYNLLPFVPYEIESLINNLFYFGESNDVFDYGPWLPDRSILTYLFLLIIHFYIRSKIKLKAKQKQKKKTVLRSLVEKIGGWNNTGDFNNTDNYSNGIVIMGGAALIVIFAIGTINRAVEFGDYLIVTDEEKAEMREQEAQKRQREREIQQAVWDKEKMERIAQLLPNAHPNVRRAIEAKGLKLSCEGDANYTITFDDLNVYVNGYENFKSNLRPLIESSLIEQVEFTGENINSTNPRGTVIRKEFDFKNWKIDIEISRNMASELLQFRYGTTKESRSCKATYNKPSNNPSTNSASKSKEPKLNAVPASKSIQEIRESVKNRTQDKDH
jgi:hypothetical protein